MNIKTVALTREQYQAIIQTMKQGFTGCRPNERVATGRTSPCAMYALICASDVL